MDLRGQRVFPGVRLFHLLKKKVLPPDDLIQEPRGPRGRAVMGLGKEVR